MTKKRNPGAGGSAHGVGITSHDNVPSLSTSNRDAATTLQDHPLADAATRKRYVEKIKAAMRRSVEGFIEVGRQLLEAKEKLAHGQFEPMVNDDLKMTRQTASRLMKIAKHPVISNGTHVHHLPPAWGTLYELTKVPTPRLEAKLKDGTINPQMERADVKELLPAQRSTKKKKYETDDDPEEETTAVSSRDEEEDHAPELTEEERWQRSVSNMAGEAISLDSYYTREFGAEWRNFAVPSHILKLAKQAADAWASLAAQLASYEASRPKACTPAPAAPSADLDDIPEFLRRTPSSRGAS